MVQYSTRCTHNFCDVADPVNCVPEKSALDHMYMGTVDTSDSLRIDI